MAKINISISAGYVNTGEWYEKQCTSWEDAFSEVPEFLDRARGDWSSANALIVVDKDGELWAAPWHEAKTAWIRGGEEALLEVLTR